MPGQVSTTTRRGRAGCRRISSSTSGRRSGGRQSWRRVKSVQISARAPVRDQRIELHLGDLGLDAALAEHLDGEFGRRTVRPRLVVHGLPHRCQAGQRVGAGQLATTRSRACAVSAVDEGRQVGDVVEHVRGDDDVAHRDAIGDVGPQAVVRRDGDPAATRIGLERRQHRPLAVHRVQVTAGRHQVQTGRPRSRTDVQQGASGAQGRTGTPLQRRWTDVLTGGEQSGWEAVRRLRRSGQDLRVDRPSGQLVRPPSRCTICHHRAEVIQAR